MHVIFFRAREANVLRDLLDGAPSVRILDLRQNPQLTSKGVRARTGRCAHVWEASHVSVYSRDLGRKFMAEVKPLLDAVLNHPGITELSGIPLRASPAFFIHCFSIIV